MLIDHIDIDPIIFLNVYDKLMADEAARYYRRFARKGHYRIDGRRHDLNFNVIVPIEDMRDPDSLFMIRMTFLHLVSVRFYYKFTNGIPSYYSHPSADVFVKMESYNKENLEHHLTMLSLGIPVELEVN